MMFVLIVTGHLEYFRQDCTKTEKINTIGLAPKHNLFGEVYSPLHQIDFLHCFKFTYFLRVQQPGRKSHIKKNRVHAHQKFWVPSSYFVGVAFFSPLRGAIYKTTHDIWSTFFSAQYPKSTTKAPAANLLWLNTHRDTKTAFLTCG